MAKIKRKNGFPIPESELDISFSRGGGPGGQNVNKVETKVIIKWNFWQSRVLSREQKILIGEKLRNRINDLGELTVYAQTERSQSQNRAKAIKALSDLIRSALAVSPKRIPTKTTRPAKERRLKAKARHSEKKSLRRKKF